MSMTRLISLGMFLGVLVTLLCVVLSAETPTTTADVVLKAAQDAGIKLVVSVRPDASPSR
jgi:hypothetical protein